LMQARAAPAHRLHRWPLDRYTQMQYDHPTFFGPSQIILKL
jgi:hypothetical protein